MLKILVFQREMGDSDAIWFYKCAKHGSKSLFQSLAISLEFLAYSGSSFLFGWWPNPILHPLMQVIEWHSAGYRMLLQCPITYGGYRVLPSEGALWGER